MTPPDTAASADPHHGSGPDGSVLVRHLGTGYALMTFAIPALILVTAAIAASVTSVATGALLVGVALGALQIIAGALVERFTHGPLLQMALQHGANELLRLAAVLSALLIPMVAGGQLARGAWVGIGAAVAPLAIMAANAVAYRKALLHPSELGRTIGQTALDRKLGARGVIAREAVSQVALVLWAVGASMLQAAAPAMVVATLVLSFGAALVGRLADALPPARAARSPYTWAGPAVSLLVFLLAIGLAVLG